MGPMRIHHHHHPITHIFQNQHKNIRRRRRAARASRSRGRGASARWCIGAGKGCRTSRCVTHDCDCGVYVCMYVCLSLHRHPSSSKCPQHNTSTNTLPPSLSLTHTPQQTPKIHNPYRWAPSACTSSTRSTGPRSPPSWEKTSGRWRGRGRCRCGSPRGRPSGAWASCVFCVYMHVCVTGGVYSQSLPAVPAAHSGGARPVRGFAFVWLCVSVWLFVCALVGGSILPPRPTPPPMPVCLCVCTSTPSLTQTPTPTPNQKQPPAQGGRAGGADGPHREQPGGPYGAGRRDAGGR